MEKNLTTTPPTGSQRKSRKRAAAKRKASEEAQRATSEDRAAKVPRTDEKVVGERGVVDEIEPRQNKRSTLSKSVDKEELVRRAVAHAAAAVDSFPMDEEDDDDDDEATRCAGSASHCAGPKGGAQLCC